MARVTEQQPEANPARQTSARQTWASRGFRLARRTACALPFGVVSSLGALCGGAAWYLNGKRRIRTVEHLKIAYPELSHRDRVRRAKRSFRTMGRVAAETFWIPRMSLEWFRENFILETPEAEDQFREACKIKGGIVLTAHLGNWELMLQYCQVVLEGTLMGVASQPEDLALAEELKALREALGGRIVWRGNAALPLLRGFKRGDVAGMIVDHNLRGDGIRIKFFGEKAHTLLAPAQVALRARVPIAIVACNRRPDGKYAVRWELLDPLPPLASDPGERFAQEANLTLYYTARIEDLVRQNPDQWMWMHQRWRYRKKDSRPWPPASSSQDEEPSSPSS